MEIKKGIAVSPGVVISTAVVLDAEDLVIPRRVIAPADAPAEIERLGKAIAESVVHLTKLRDEVAAKHGKEIGSIFDFHLGILKDKSMLKQITTEITTKNFSAEYAVLVPEREFPGGMGAHEVEHPTGQLVVMDSCVTR